MVLPVQNVMPESLGAMERHYAPEEVGEAWGLSADTVRRIFDGEPGVLVIENRRAGSKRRYRTLRIPASVVDLVYRRRLTKQVPSGRLALGR